MASKQPDSIVGVSDHSDGSGGVRNLGEVGWFCNARYIKSLFLGKRGGI